MKTVLRFLAIIAIGGFGWQSTMLFALPDTGFIHPGDPNVRPSESLTVPSFDHLIPTTYPTIQTGDPMVHPWQSLTIPINNPLIPTGMR
ncbi:MAG: hypothetical protein WCD79_09170 [Chthoniobacteraceae bacterium]